MSHTYNAVYYRNTHYSSAEDAESMFALRHWHVTHGYSATMDAFLNVIDALKCYDPSVLNEFTFIFTIDGYKFPEMNYKEVFMLLDASYNNFQDGKHKMLEKGKKLTVEIC